MEYYNGQLKKLEQALQQGKDRKQLEQTYSCQILFLSDKDYHIHFNRILQERALLLDYYEDGEIIGKVAWSEERQTVEEMQDHFLRIGLVLAILPLGGYLLLLFLYLQMIRPFRKLQQFSTQIAKGNFDFPLPIQKNNFFGAFTESFDLMREELKRAKESEYQANQSKKELVAELSHDIKTPISTIKATCEVMQLKEKQADTLEKVRVIAAKADTVERLIGNLFHATLEELEILKVEPTEESSLCIIEMFQELKYYGEIILECEIPECLLLIDRLRLEQVIDNLINNSYKYAGTPIFVSFDDWKEGIVVRIRDQGPGIPEEEIAFITKKFYRGSNAKGKSGSGLGLYLSKLFMEQMGGTLDCYAILEKEDPNKSKMQERSNGFQVELFIQKV